MKKQAIKIFTITLIFLSISNQASAGIFGDIINIIGGWVSSGVKTLNLAADMQEVAGYPNQYIRKANAITADINSIKNMEGLANIPQKSFKQLSRMLSSIGNSLTSSLKSFDSLLDVLDEATQSLVNPTEGSTKPLMSEVVRDIKKQHRENMSDLNKIHSSVLSLKRIVMEEHNVNQVMDKINDFDIYNNSK